MVPDSFGNSMTSDRRKKKLVTVVGVAAALLLGFVFATTATANTNNIAAYATTTAETTSTGKLTKADAARIVPPIEDPPFLVPFSQAAATVEKEFPIAKLQAVRGSTL